MVTDEKLSAGFEMLERNIVHFMVLAQAQGCDIRDMVCVVDMRVDLQQQEQMRCESIGEFQAWLLSMKIPDDKLFKYMAEIGGNILVAVVVDHPNGATVFYQPIDYIKNQMENLAQLVKMNWPKDPFVQTQLMAAIKEADSNEKAIAIVGQFK